LFQDRCQFFRHITSPRIQHHTEVAVQGHRNHLVGVHEHLIDNLLQQLPPRALSSSVA